MAKPRTSKKPRSKKIDIHSANDNKVTSVFIWNTTFLRNQWVLFFLALALVATVIFAFKVFAATTTSSHPPFGIIQVPKPGNNYRGNILAEGWALDTRKFHEGPISSVQIYFDQVDSLHYIGAAERGFDKSAVCAQPEYSGSVGCPNIGWQKVIRTLKNHISDGNHILIAKIIDKDKKPHYFLARQHFSVKNAARGTVGAGKYANFAVEALKYETVAGSRPYYYYILGGGHAPGTTELDRFAVNGGGMDCSGFIRMVIWRVNHFDIGPTVAQDYKNNPNFHRINSSQVAAGDIGVVDEPGRGPHIEFITDNDDKSDGVVEEFGAHSTKNDIYGGTSDLSHYTYFLRYNGP